MSAAATPHFTTFGRYEIVRKLGRSMSDVYLAHDPAINRYVVLKIVEQCQDSFTLAIVDAERRGAAIQQQLHALDARILEIYAAGEHNGSFFIAMQYAEGRSLAELLQEQGRIDPVRAARYAAEICSQLRSLHSFEAEIDGHKRAVVHGDIKPGNIQIGPEDEVRLLDFGIAKAISATRKLTHHELGSPAYCSPERLNSSQVDPHADLWAVGVCLYEMISGLPPYQAQTTRKLESVIQSRRPPRALPAGCPSALRAIIQKALAADPARRFASAADLEDDLNTFLAHKPTTAEAAAEHGWHANATIETPNRATPNRAAIKGSGFYTTLSAQLRAVRAPLFAGMLAGFFLFVPAFHLARFWNETSIIRTGRDYARAAAAEISADFDLVSRVDREYSWLRSFSPAAPLRDTLRSRYLASANQLFAAYRNNASASLDQFDWQKVTLMLRHALTLSPGNSELQGKLALAAAYSELSRPRFSAEAARARLEEAASLLTNAPDPHLTLARLYVYQDGNLGRAAAEWNTAERLGFQPGPREWEQEGDAYLARVESSLRRMRAASADEDRRQWLTLLQRDISRARTRYEPIAGFGNVSTSLEKLARYERAAVLPKPVRSRRWR